jgi:hypothetical protein
LREIVLKDGAIESDQSRQADHVATVHVAGGTQ